ncbi:MAG: hypothetical protein ACYC0V_12545 [Armatimonadota bacterium]
MEWFYNGFVITKNTPDQFYSDESPYYGVGYGEPWPLQIFLGSKDLTEDESKLAQSIRELTDYQMAIRTDGLPAVAALGVNTYLPSLVNDVALVARYAKACTTRDIGVRILFCATSCDHTQMENQLAKTIVENARFLGYDYASWQCAFSALDENMYIADLSRDVKFFSGVKTKDGEDYLEPPEYMEGRICLNKYISFLNMYGLFNDSTILEEYIMERWDVFYKTCIEIGNLRYALGEGSVELWPFAVYEVDESLRHLLEI